MTCSDLNDFDEITKTTSKVPAWFALIHRQIDPWKGRKKRHNVDGLLCRWRITWITHLSQVQERERWRRNNTQLGLIPVLHMMFWHTVLMLYLLESFLETFPSLIYSAPSASWTMCKDFVHLLRTSGTKWSCLPSGNDWLISLISNLSRTQNHTPAYLLQCFHHGCIQLTTRVSKRWKVSPCDITMVTLSNVCYLSLWVFWWRQPNQEAKSDEDQDWKDSNRSSNIITYWQHTWGLIRQSFTNK